MALSDTIKKLDNKNDIFRQTESKSNDFFKSAIPMMIANNKLTVSAIQDSIGRLSDKIESKFGMLVDYQSFNSNSNPNLDSASITNDNIKSTFENNERINKVEGKDYSTIITKIYNSTDILSRTQSESKLVLNLILEELKIHTGLIKKLDTSRINTVSQSPDLMDLAEDFFDKKTKKKPNSRRKPINRKVNLTKNGMSTSNSSMLSKGANVLASKGSQVAGAVIKTAAKALPFAAAATTGWQVGTAIGGMVNDNLSDSTKDKIGGAVAKTLSFFGNDEATEAVRVNTNTERGASTEKVETVKVGNLTFPKDENVKKALEFASKEFGIPMGELLSTAYQESSFNPNAKGSGSSAAGLFQFVTGTWNDLLKQYKTITDKYGIREASSGDRFDPFKSAIMYGLLRKGNVGYLKKKGLSSGDETTDSYLAHFLGMGGAAKVLEAFTSGKGNDPISKYVSNDAYNASGNKPIMKDGEGKPRSVNDFIKVMYNKSGARADAYQEKVDKGATGTASSKSPMSQPLANQDGQVPTVSSSPASNTATPTVSSSPASNTATIESVSHSRTNQDNSLNILKQQETAIANKGGNGQSKGNTPSQSVPQIVSNQSNAQNMIDNQSKGNVSNVPSQSKGNSVTASPDKKPEPARTINPTLQRILDKEYTRAI